VAASVLDVLAALPVQEWVTPSWVANRFQLTNYAGRQLLGVLHKRGLVDQGTIDPEGRRQYKVNGRGRQALSKPESVMNPEKYWGDRERRHVGAQAHRFGRATIAGRSDKDEYERRRAAFLQRKREGL
jgi:hypothetical protein